MNFKPPKVGIGLPVHNGERFLSEALESLLAQTFQDVEIIICDNASDDGTEEICRRFAKSDRRVRYYRNPYNIGAAANFNRTFELSSGEYFKWAAHDDVCAPDFLLRCVEVLDKETSVVLCHSETKVIDEFGEVIENHPHTSLIFGRNIDNIDSFEQDVRFADLIKFTHPCIDIFGLIRTNVLKQTPLISSYVGSDRNLLVELGLHGRLYRIPEYLFFSRDHEGRSLRKLPTLGSRTHWFATTKRKRIVLPHWKHYLEYSKSVRRVELSGRVRLLCYLHLAKSTLGNWRRLRDDLKEATAQVSPDWVVNVYRYCKTGFSNFQE
jgi:glycosyltransferase involved in cell wall biosynthesis